MKGLRRYHVSVFGVLSTNTSQLHVPYLVLEPRPQSGVHTLTFRLLNFPFTCYNISCLKFWTMTGMFLYPAIKEKLWILISEQCLINWIYLSMSSKACAARVSGLRTWCLKFDCSRGRARFHIVTHPTCKPKSLNYKWVSLSQVISWNL